MLVEQSHGVTSELISLGPVGLRWGGGFRSHPPSSTLFITSLLCRVLSAHVTVEWGVPLVPVHLFLHRVPPTAPESHLFWLLGVVRLVISHLQEAGTGLVPGVGEVVLGCFEAL